MNQGQKSSKKRLWRISINTRNPS